MPSVPLVFLAILALGTALCPPGNSSCLQVKPQNPPPKQPGYCNQGFYLATPINITTPNYPSLYDMSTACLWNIVGENGLGKLKFTFTDFQISKGTRFELYEGADINLQPPVFSWTTLQNTPFSVTVNSSEATAVFMTSQYLQNYKYHGISAQIIASK